MVDIERFQVSFTIDIEAHTKGDAISEAQQNIQKGLFEMFQIQTYKRPKPLSGLAKPPGWA